MFRVLEPAAMGRLELRNRFMRSATWDGTAEATGAVTDTSVRLYERLAAGEMALIVTANAFISPQGRGNIGQYGIHSDAMMPGLKRLVDVCHGQGTRIAVQIAHAGLSSRYLLRAGQVALAPSEIQGSQPHRAMTEEEIEDAIDDFVAAAVRARDIGFDAVQLHGAHGFLLSQFLSPLTNQRQDRWGGSAEKRRRFHVETVRRIRAAVGRDFPILIKLGVKDDDEGGTTLEEGIAALGAMAEVGLDAVEISRGIGLAPSSSTRVVRENGVIEQTFFRERAGAARRALNIPVALVGGIRCLETAEEIVVSGDADFISMSRPFIREPALIARWLKGDRRCATCITCGKCTAIVSRGEPLECGEERRIREELTT